MVVVTMGLRVQFLISFIFILCLCSCDKKAIYINKKSKFLELRKTPALFNHQPINGFIYDLYPNGDTLSVGFYKNGLKSGLWKVYYKGGVLKEERYFKKNKRQGLYIGFYKNGAKNFSYTFLNDEYNGTNTVWASNGKKIEEHNYLNGYEEGAQKTWYLNGKIKSNYVIKNNRRYGLLGTKNCINVGDEIL